MPLSELIQTLRLVSDVTTQRPSGILFADNSEVGVCAAVDDMELNRDHYVPPD